MFSRRRTLGTPVVQQADLLRHAQRNKIAEANHAKNHRKQAQGRTLGVEAASEGHAHALTQHPHHCLIVDGARVRKEEVGEREMEEGHRGDYGRGGDESHGCGCGGDAVRFVFCIVRGGWVMLVVAMELRWEKVVKQTAGVCGAWEAETRLVGSEGLLGVKRK